MLLGAIVGATGVGKTDLAVQYAASHGAEIISIDSRQVYSGLSIGTAQPSSEQINAVKHHLVGFLPPTDSYNVARCVNDVQQILLAKPEQRFIIVGGAGLYINALMDGMSFLPPVSYEIREQLRVLHEKLGADSMYTRLRSVDPASAQRLNPTDIQRVLRALEVHEQTGKPWSSFLGQKKGGLGLFPVFWLDMERSELYKRIDHRVISMFEAGWLQETMLLERIYPANIPALQSLGYQTVILHLEGKLNKDELISAIQRETRNYAKRQLTWFRNKMECSRFLSDGLGSGELMNDLSSFFKIK